MEILNFIIPFLVLLTVVVFVHEYGHYYFAKRYGVVSVRNLWDLMIKMGQGGNFV